MLVAFHQAFLNHRAPCSSSLKRALGRTLLNVRRVVQVKRFRDLGDAIPEIILANSGVVAVAGLYQDVCDGIERLIKDAG